MKILYEKFKVKLNLILAIIIKFITKYYLELEKFMRFCLLKNDKITTIVLIITVLFGFIILPIYHTVMFSIERHNWYTSSYYINSKIQDNLFKTKEDREREVILKIVGYLKMNNCKWTDDEMYKYSKIIFAFCDENNWDYFVPVIVAQKKTNFDKNYINQNGERGMYKLNPIIADLVSSKIGSDYYNGMEFDVVNSTNIWLAYMKVLMNKFNDMNLALIAYDVTFNKFINDSNIVLDAKFGTYSIDNLDKIRKKFYGKNSFDIQVVNDAKKMRFLGYFDGIGDDMNIKKDHH
jgi:hypothetical protein